MYACVCVCVCVCVTGIYTFTDLIYDKYIYSEILCMYESAITLFCAQPKDFLSCI